MSCVDKIVGHRPLVERKEALELVVEERVDAIATECGCPASTWWSRHHGIVFCCYST